MSPTGLPVAEGERSHILDVLRGIALLGICVANYPVISLYIFQSPEKLAAFDSASIDRIMAYVHFIFIDGKFYSLFSLLFGIGFTIILRKATSGKRRGPGIFYRRLLFLVLIGLIHALLIWEGDILLLYALLGMLLPAFRNLRDSTLLILAVALILSPILFDLIKIWTNNYINAGNLLLDRALVQDARVGINNSNFPTWVADRKSYSDRLGWLQSGFWWRWQMLFDSNRLPKVLAMFLLGLYAGRHLIYNRLEENILLFKKLRNWCLIIGLPSSVAYAYFEMDGRHLPDVYGLTDTVSYALSVIPMSIFYTSVICLLYLQPQARKRLLVFAPVGRMALTNYLVQSIIGTFIFWGTGLAFGGKVGVSYVLLIAVGVYLLQIFYSTLWMRYFLFGPAEWLWKSLTYWRLLPIRKKVGTISADS